MRWILLILLLLNIALYALFWRSSPAVEQLSNENNIEETSALVLLSEVRTAPAAVRLNLPALGAGELVIACYELGPFMNSADAEQFALEHKNIFATQIESRQIQTRVDYRVYLPPYMSRDAAESALKDLRAKLQAANVAIDTLLITRGNLENGVALGLFAQQQNALNVENQLSRLGYEVLIIEEPRTQEQLWISLFELPEGARLLPQWSAIQQRRSYLQRLEKLC